MKNHLLASILFLAFFIPTAEGQYVTISDPGMLNWLLTNYPAAMVGNEMDTTSFEITSTTSLNLSGSGIQSLDALQYFDNLYTLNINGGTGLYLEISILPPSLKTLLAFNANLNSLPSLPFGLELLECSSNQISVLPFLPASLTYLNCSENPLTAIPELPSNLETLTCNSCQLSSLPLLPSTLTGLSCNNNQLLELPELTSLIQFIQCSNNLISTMPDLPNTMYFLNCDSNPNLTCLPILPNNLSGLNIGSTLISCLPNYPSQLNSINIPLPPLCMPNNANGCITTVSISGGVFDNQNDDCINTQNLTTNVVFNLYDNQDNLLQSHSSSLDSNYYFIIQPGDYLVRVDSSYFTNCVEISCPLSGQHNVTALLDSSYTDRDFGFSCTGIDLGVEAISHEGIVFPGQPHSIKAITGDLSNFFGLNCANGTGGTVQISVNGPVTYTGTSGNALTPSVSGNSYTYNFADFGTTNVQESFVLDFLTETTAQSGDLVTVSVSIISNGNDLDSTNNTLSYSYVVVNSYDPNMKEVNPVDVLPGYEDYFTYTVHFQNLGTAPAFNINIKDTLDSNLDFSTFRVINASHDYSYNLSGDLLTVYFQNIMLADSASDPEGSKGFVQYQVKPKANLPLGTSIENTAHIFFDFNEAVVTNTTINNFVEEVGINEILMSEFSIYPNPSSDFITIQCATLEKKTIEIYNYLGQKLKDVSVSNNSKIDVSDLSTGIYFVKVKDFKNQIVRFTIE